MTDYQKTLEIIRNFPQEEQNRYSFFSKGDYLYIANTVGTMRYDIFTEKLLDVQLNDGIVFPQKGE